MSKLSLGAKLFIVITMFALAATGIAVRGVFGLQNLDAISTQLVEVEFQRQSRWYDVRADLRLLILRERELILEQKEVNRVKITEQIDEVYQDLHAQLAIYMGMADEAGQTKAAEFAGIMDRWFNVNLQVREKRLEGHDEAAFELANTDGNKIREEADEFIKGQIVVNRSEMEQQVLMARESFKSARLSMILFSIFAMSIGSVLGVYVLRSVTQSVDGVIRRLDDNSTKVTATSKQIATSADNLSQAATEQAASLEETAASIEEFNQMVQSNLDAAKRAATISGVSQASAEKGKQVVGEMMRAIGEIDSSNAQIMNQVEQSNLQIGEITKVIAEIGNKTKVINDIVFQTKLLSFNASVEAARAGEHGKGFAVVAEEVGNLAEMSGVASKEISSMLDESIRKVEGIVNDTRTKVEVLIRSGKEKVEVGTRIAEECSAVLIEIVSKVSEVTDMSQSIAHASQEQALGVDQISRAMHQIDQVTQTNASAAESTAAAAEELSGQSIDLRELIVNLTHIVKGQSTGIEVGAVAPKNYKTSVIKNSFSEFGEDGKLLDLRRKDKSAESHRDGNKSELAAVASDLRSSGASKASGSSVSGAAKGVAKVLKLAKSDSAKKSVAGKTSDASKKPGTQSKKSAAVTALIAKNEGASGGSDHGSGSDKKVANGADLAIPSENDPRFQDI
jgi:methyl-accepting chemotaxis protein